jgi:hypothetical protein
MTDNKIYDSQNLNGIAVKALVQFNNDVPFSLVDGYDGLTFAENEYILLAKHLDVFSVGTPELPTKQLIYRLGAKGSQGAANNAFPLNIAPKDFLSKPVVIVTIQQGSFAGQSWIGGNIGFQANTDITPSITWKPFSRNLSKSDIVGFLESDYVHTTGDETVLGVKTFGSLIQGSIQNANVVLGVAPALSYYGTNNLGVKGFYLFPGVAVGGDMTKAVYDTADNGIVDQAESINGITSPLQYYGTNGANVKGFYNQVISSSGKTIYVDTNAPSGNDSLTRTELIGRIDLPCRTLARACSIALGGDTIIINPGLYADTGTINIINPIRIIGIGAEFSDPINFNISGIIEVIFEGIGKFSFSSSVIITQNASGQLKLKSCIFENQLTTTNGTVILSDTSIFLFVVNADIEASRCIIYSISTELNLGNYADKEIICIDCQIDNDIQCAFRRILLQRCTITLLDEMILLSNNPLALDIVMDSCTVQVSTASKKMIMLNTGVSPKIINIIIIGTTIYSNPGTPFLITKESGTIAVTNVVIVDSRTSIVPIINLASLLSNFTSIVYSNYSILVELGTSFLYKKTKI